MPSINFEFLQHENEALSSLGSFAEQYAHSDPGSAVVKLRTFGETIVDALFHTYDLIDEDFGRTPLNDKLNDARLKEYVPDSVIEKLHALRKRGNDGAHGRTVHPTTANWLLQQAHSLGRWYHLKYCGGIADDLPAFQEILEPTSELAGAPSSEASRITDAMRAAQERQSEELNTLVAETASKMAHETRTRPVPEHTHERARNEQIADALGFDEATTRQQMIDCELMIAGWDVGPGERDTEEVGKEIEVEHQPTTSGLGYADYVLWDEHGRPIGVIEAKKTARDAHIGQEQARLYADGLERMHGHRPVIFYTNGHEIWMWNDADDEPPRKLHGFYSKDSLSYLVARRTIRTPVQEIVPNPEIAGRMYQLEAVTRLLERFSRKDRNGLIVQATGTGKTRVAVSLCDAMIQAKWARRILFLCDRRELRKQAKNVFQEFTSESLVTVTRKTYKEREHRIYLSTYPAMRKLYESFDVGFFDLIIADESHRSIYNRYRDLFTYFDACKVGLTATPVKFISRNTYTFFGCPDQDPTAHFSYEQAINHTPAYLVPFQAEQVDFGFIERGIKYSEMSTDQRTQLEEQANDPEAIEFEKHQVDKSIFNKDTNRLIITNLMENGLRVEDGTELGKSIIFARNHRHAVLLQNIFDELYPQYGGRMCRVIDNYDPRAEQLIDEFKDPADPMKIAVSVDMLDTGIDVPEVVNLVFAKPVFSYVKFWQMIGRGTRLCPDLHGPGLDKTRFLIFDHWKNFAYFEEQPTEIDTPPSKSLFETLFEARLDLAEHAIEEPDLETFTLMADLLRKDLVDLPDRTIAVKESWRDVQTLRRQEVLEQFDPATRVLLRGTIAPLMKWRTGEAPKPAYAFDLLIAKLQNDLLTGGSSLDDHRDEFNDRIARLQMSLPQVREKAETIERVKTLSFWTGVTIQSLEAVRLELRGIMRYCLADRPPALEPRVVDVAEDDAFTSRSDVTPAFSGLQEAAYRRRVDEALQAIMDQSPALQKIRRGEPVTSDELASITALVLAQEQDLNLSDLLEYYPDAVGLDRVLQSIIGLDPAAVEARFQAFAGRHPLRATQLKFLDLLQNHIARYGSIKVEQLYDAPFTTLDTAGIDGVFEDESQIDELLEIMSSFGPDPDSTTDDDQPHNQNQTQDKDPNHS